MDQLTDIRGVVADYEFDLVTTVPDCEVDRGTRLRALHDDGVELALRESGKQVLDNRKGTATLRLRPAERTVRAVNELHEQVEAVDLPKLLAAGGGARDAQAQAQALARRAGDQDCLPGAYLCALAAFPEGTDLEKLSTLFWTPGGAAEAVKLLPIWLADDEIADLRRSLR